MGTWNGDPRELQAPMACIVDFPSRFPTHPSPIAAAPQFYPVPIASYPMPFTHRLSDEDVERIAKRVAELLKVGT